MYNCIEKIYKNKAFSSFYDDILDTQKHFTGMVNMFNETLVLISHVNSRGEYDGYILKRIDDIFQIDIDGNYENKIKRLYNYKNQIHNLSISENNNLETALLQYSIDNKLVSRFENEDNMIIGFVQSFNNNIVKINQLDDYANIMCETIIDIDKFDTISVDTDYEQDLKLLYNLK